MRTKILAILLVALFAVSVAATPRVSKYSTPSMSATIDNSTFINANKILMFVTNHGNFGRDLSGVFGHDYGTYFPNSDSATIASGADIRSPLYASGLWVGGQTGSPQQTRIALSEYSSEFVPGPMANNTFQTDRPEFRVYKLDKLGAVAVEQSDDYLNWPADQGAPVDTLGLPAFVGDQFLWSVFNDADPSAHDNDAGSTAPLGIEVKQSVFAFNREDALGNVVFVRLRIYNKGTNVINNCYFSVWADPDLGGSGDDLVGCDTNLSIGYCYNATNNDADYGKTPPCIGYDFFQGPLVPGTAADTGYMWDKIDTTYWQCLSGTPGACSDSEEVTINDAYDFTHTKPGRGVFPGMKNLGMVSFNKYINGTDPNNSGETYNYMQGLLANGDPYTYNGNVNLYYGSGNPAAIPPVGSGLCSGRPSVHAIDRASNLLSRRFDRDRRGYYRWSGW